MELAITIGCWIAAAIAFLFFGLCFSVTVGVAFRCAFTGKTGSGLPLIGSIVATAGILVAPVATFYDRLCWSWVPIVFEVSTIVILILVCWISGRKLSR